MPQSRLQSVLENRIAKKPARSDELTESAEKAASSAADILGTQWREVVIDKWEEWLMKKVLRRTQESIDSARERSEFRQITGVVVGTRGGAVTLYRHFNELDIAAIQDKLEELGEDPAELQSRESTTLSLPTTTAARVQRKLTAL